MKVLCYPVRSIAIGLAAATVLASPGYGQSCAERFVELMIGSQKFDQMYKLDITQEMKGGLKTVGTSLSCLTLRTG